MGGVTLPHPAPPPPLVYSEEDDHPYCHHEVLLGSFPLALEWLDFDPDDPEQRGGRQLGNPEDHLIPLLDCIAHVWCWEQCSGHHVEN